MVRKTLSFSKEEESYEHLVPWRTWYNLARPLKSLRVEVNNDQRRWEPRSPAMAAGITDHIWTIGEIMMMVTFLRETTRNGDYHEVIESIMDYLYPRIKILSETWSSARLWQRMSLRSKIFGSCITMSNIPRQAETKSIA